MRRVERRDVDALELRQRRPQRVAVARIGLARGEPLPHHLVHFADDLFAVAQHEGVDEVGERLGVVRTVAAGDHQRIGTGPVRGVQWEAGQVDEVQHVGVDQLGREVEGQQVECGRG